MSVEDKTTAQLLAIVDCGRLDCSQLTRHGRCGSCPGCKAKTALAALVSRAARHETSERELLTWQDAYQRALNFVAAHNMAIDDGDDYGEHVGLQSHRRAVQTGHGEILRFFSPEKRAEVPPPLPTGELLKRDKTDV